MLRFQERCAHIGWVLAAPLAVQFSDQSTVGTKAITAWLWEFGDGGYSTAQNPAHTYQTAGSYDVSLTVTAGGTINQKTVTDSLSHLEVETPSMPPSPDPYLSQISD